jgi:hypothetical protein
MTIKVYKTDFSIFPGLYNAVVYQNGRITRNCQNFLEVDFGPEHMNPYTLADYFVRNERMSYKGLMELLGDIDLIDLYLLDQAYALISRYRHSTDDIMRRINAATCYPVGHINRRLF